MKCLSSSNETKSNPDYLFNIKPSDVYTSLKFVVRPAYCDALSRDRNGLHSHTLLLHDARVEIPEPLLV